MGNSRGLIRHRNRHTRSVQGSGQKRDSAAVWHVCCIDQVTRVAVVTVTLAVSVLSVTMYMKLRLTRSGPLHTQMMRPSRSASLFPAASRHARIFESFRTEQKHGQTSTQHVQHRVSNSQEHSNQHQHEQLLDLDETVYGINRSKLLNPKETSHSQTSRLCRIHLMMLISWAHNEQFNPDQNEIQRVIHFNKERLSCKNCWMKQEPDFVKVREHDHSKRVY